MAQSMEAIGQTLEKLPQREDLKFESLQVGQQLILDRLNAIEAKVEAPHGKS
jgi:hypothetical protein